MRKKPMAIDLFAGCGGLTLGLKQAGFRVVAAVENDSVAVETYKANHPKVQMWNKDIRTKGLITDVMTTLNLKKGQLDLLAGCPPCQGFSSMRTLQGSKRIRDQRNSLVNNFLSFVIAFMPRTIMFENVPGLIKNRRFAEFKKSLLELGYIPNVKILNAADYEVPQRRRRLILIAALGKKIEFAPTCDNKLSVRDFIFNLPKPGRSGDYLHDLPESRSEKVKRIIKSIPRNGGGRDSIPRELKLACHLNFAGFKDVYGRMAWDDVAPTITGGCNNPSKGRFIHPSQNRAITLREAALLQTFPPEYKFSLLQGKGAVATMIGNALPPAFIEYQARAIKEGIRNV